MLPHKECVFYCLKISFCHSLKYSSKFFIIIEAHNAFNVFLKPYQVLLLLFHHIYLRNPSTRMKMKAIDLNHIFKTLNIRLLVKPNANEHKKGLRQGIFMIFVLICCRKRQLKALKDKTKSMILI